MILFAFRAIEAKKVASVSRKFVRFSLERENCPKAGLDRTFCMMYYISQFPPGKKLIFLIKCLSNFKINSNELKESLPLGD